MHKKGQRTLPFFVRACFRLSDDPHGGVIPLRGFH